jgi:general secretion pathway protein D
MKIRAWVAIALLASSPAFAADDKPAPPAGGPGIEVTELIAQVAKRTGKVFVLDPRVRGEVPLTGFDPAKVDYPMLLAILRVNLYVAVQEQGFVSVVPDANLRQLSTPTYSNLEFKAQDDEVVTVLLKVKNACTAYVVPVLRPLMPQAAHLAAEVQSNVLIITDRAANVRRIGGLVEQLDRSTTAGQNCKNSFSSM